VNLLNRFKHPFPLLLQLEWILLCITILSLLSPAPLFQPFRLTVLAFISIIGFGLMGLWLPTRNLTHKIVFTAIEFGLILFVATVGFPGIQLFPALYAIVVMRSCLIFAPIGRLVVAGVALATSPVMLFIRIRATEWLFIKAIKSMPEPGTVPFPVPASPLPIKIPITQDQVKFVLWNLSLNAVVSFGLMLVFLLLLVNALLSERQSREKLAIANDQLRQYAYRIEDQATLQERNRIARDIHDSLGHALTALNLQLEGALKLWQADPARSRLFLTEAKRLGSTALQEVRQSVTTLRSDSLRKQPLEVTIASLVQEFYQTTGILPQFSYHCSSPHTISAEVSTAAYRVVQEALTNICKHAAATQVNICLEAAPFELCLTIQDNGNGFDPSHNTTGFGVQGMQERTVATGGEFSIRSRPGAGCFIFATFPLSKIAA
jgi:signal transduction histidine kinase